MSGSLHDNVSWVYDALTFQLGWALGYSQWRTILALISPLFRSWLEKFLAGLVPEDREWIGSTLNHRWWRITRAGVLALTAIQLPSIEAVNTAVAARKAKADTGFTKKPTDAAYPVDPKPPTT